MPAILRDFATVVVVVRTRPRAIPLAMVTVGKFPFLSYTGMVLSAWGPFGPAELR